LLDLLMPGLTGFELCRTLSSLSLTQRIPILVLSGNPVEQFRDYCSHLGAEDYFQKPIDFVRLRVRINQLVNERLLERRPELRLKMQVAIELRGLNRFGKAFHEVTATQDISVTGFRCACATPLGQKSVVEVFLRGGSARRRVGRAEVVHALRSGQDAPQYGFHFMQKPSEWLL
jgi:response regulator RpfG family c-di-GMP phosphodiesterase